MIDEIRQLIMRPEVYGPAALLLVPLVLLLRWAYAHRYVKRRLFFEPWVNVSGDSSLDIGVSLSELLYFELNSLREVLAKAREDSIGGKSVPK